MTKPVPVHPLMVVQVLGRWDQHILDVGHQGTYLDE